MIHGAILVFKSEINIMLFCTAKWFHNLFIK